MKTLFSLFVLLTIGACERDSLYDDADLTENVAKAYEECEPTEIEFLTRKNNIQLVFDACGSNNFAAFEWSPNGIQIYFQLTHGGHILNAETGGLTTVPTETPISGGAWIRNGLLAVPIAPSGLVDATTSGEKASRLAKESGSFPRIAMYDLDASMLNVLPLSIREPKDLQSLGDGRQLVLTGLDETGIRRPYRFDPATGEATRILPWLDHSVDRLVYEAKSGLVAWSSGGETEVNKIDSGDSVLVLPDATRIIPHPDGRYWALETQGAPISPYFQRSWDEIPKQARERELERLKKWEEELPDWAPREIHPPELQIIDTTDGTRMRITAFFGDHFEWYTPKNYFCSFMLWGVEGKQLHRNVGLTDMAEKLRMIGQGDTPLGIERMPTVSSIALGPAADSP